MNVRKSFVEFVLKVHAMLATGLTWAEVREDLGYDGDRRRLFKRMYRTRFWRQLRAAMRVTTLIAE